MTDSTSTTDTSTTDLNPVAPQENSETPSPLAGRAGEGSNSANADSGIHSHDVSSNTQPPGSGVGNAGVGPRPRKIYESTLIPDRKRLRVSPFITFPAIVVVISVVYYFLVEFHPIRPIHSAGRVVFSATDTPGGPSRLYTAGIDGSGQTPVGNGISGDTGPAFSPDGNQIAFSSSRLTATPQVFVVDADGKNPHAVTHNSGTKTSVSFQPTRPQSISFLSSGTLFVADEHTGDADRLLPVEAAKRPGASNTEGEDQTPDVVDSYMWAPARDAAHQPLAAVVVTHGVDVLAIMPSIDKGDVIDSRKVSGVDVPLVAAHTMTLGWSPDGSHVAVAMIGTPGPNGTPVSAILLFDLSGSPVQNGPVFVTPSASVGPEHPVFTPDGSQVVFEMWSEPTLADRHCLGLFEAPTTGGQPHRILSGEAIDETFGPDGTLYFLGGRSDGGHDLYSLDISARKDHRLSNGIVDVTAYSLSPQHH
ncbi:MAG: TolB family protein [Capsulimonadaceae bacterium]